MNDVAMIPINVEHDVDRSSAGLVPAQAENGALGYSAWQGQGGAPIIPAVPRSADQLRSPLSYLVTGLTAEGDPGRLTYAVYALLHPLNLIAVTMTAIVGLFATSLWFIPATLGIEALLVSVAPRLPGFRKRVDKLIDEIARAKVAQERELQMLQMTDAHRRELERLEYLIGIVRYNSYRNTVSETALLDRNIDLGRLLTSFIRLAVAYRERSELQRMVSVEALKNEIDYLETQIEYATAPTIKALLQRRLSVVMKRIRHWYLTDEALQVISQQMSTINHIVQLLHAQSVSPTGASVTSRELDRFMIELEETERVIEEVVEFDADLSRAHRLEASGNA